MRRNEWSGPIWPTGTVAGRPLSADMVAVRVAAVRAYLACGWSLDAVRHIHPRAVEAFEHSQRTRGIAEGRRLAARRMERFRLWLLPLDAIAESRSRRYVSPEQYAIDAVEHGDAWPFFALGGDWLVRWYETHREGESGLVDELVGAGRWRRRGPSPEWAALPWQREGGR